MKWKKLFKKIATRTPYIKDVVQEKSIEETYLASIENNVRYILSRTSQCEQHLKEIKEIALKWERERLLKK